MNPLPIECQIFADANKYFEACALIGEMSAWCQITAVRLRGDEEYEPFEIQLRAIYPLEAADNPKWR